MLFTILPEGKIKHNWYTSLSMNYLQQRCTVVIYAKWYPNGRQAVSMNDEGRNEKVMRVEAFPSSLAILRALQSVPTKINHYPSIRCKHELHRTQLCGALYPVSTATQNTTELVVRLRCVPQRWTQERSDGSTGTTPASAASISCANFN
ncbi:hypothetical protein WA026_019799 [Henosepilachna vigintioctopunctata]|uniref:Uncharacterized protein n=1 Tax=Henosepilachna vigintioctopunctata TaxID=420089 RepID=A0AAW1VCB3_9CUCU